MQGYVYRILNIVNGKQYIGSSFYPDRRKRRHFNDLRSGKHHNIHLQRSFLKHGDHSFIFEVIDEIVTSEKTVLFELEQRYLDTTLNLFNIGKTASGGDNISNHPDLAGIKERAKATNKLRLQQMSDTDRHDKYAKYGDRNGMFGKTHTDSMKLKLRDRLLEYHSKGLIPSRAGKTNVELFGQDVADVISKKLSDYRKTRFGDKNGFFGKTHTAEFKKASSIRTKEAAANMTTEDRIKHKAIKFVEIDGIIYEGASKAAKAIGCSPGNITYKLKSDKYQNYRYVDKNTGNYLNFDGSIIE